MWIECPGLQACKYRNFSIARIKSNLKFSHVLTKEICLPNIPPPIKKFCQGSLKNVLLEWMWKSGRCNILGIPKWKPCSSQAKEDTIIKVCHHRKITGSEQCDVRVNQQTCHQGALSHSPARGYFTPGLTAPPLPLEGPGVVFPELVGVAGLETGVEAFSLGTDYKKIERKLACENTDENDSMFKFNKSHVHNEINNWKVMSCSTAIHCIRERRTESIRIFHP